MEQGRAVKTAIARATEAIEAAEMMFAEETSDTLNRSPRQKPP
jgi:hypothetical protein